MSTEDCKIFIDSLPHINISKYSKWRRTKKYKKDNLTLREFTNSSRDEVVVAECGDTFSLFDFKLNTTNISEDALKFLGPEPLFKALSIDNIKPGTEISSDVLDSFAGIETNTQFGTDNKTVTYCESGGISYLKMNFHADSELPVIAFAYWSETDKCIKSFFPGGAGNIYNILENRAYTKADSVQPDYDEAWRIGFAQMKNIIEKDYRDISRNSSINPLKPNSRDALIKIIANEISVHGANCNLNHIDVSQIRDMTSLFYESPFNGDISEWDVSGVTDMSWMFRYSKFKGDISKWNVSKVTNMSAMFNASKFEGDISKWDVSQVVRMDYMFYYSTFNGHIGDWNVSALKNASSMFQNSIFNRDISRWNTANLQDMGGMFSSSKFNQDISNWNVSKVIHMGSAFSMSDFNQDLSKWTPLKLKSLENFLIEIKLPLPYWAKYDDLEERKEAMKNYKLRNKLSTKIAVGKSSRPNKL